MKGKCNHFLGFLGSEEISSSDIKDKAYELADHHISLKEYDLLNGEPQTVKELLDGRKGYLSRFNYCPYCGEKINWESVVSECLESYI